MQGVSDYTHGEYKKESRLLLQALEAGVQKEIITSVELELCKKQQVRVLQEEYFLKTEITVDVVDTFSLILKGDKAKTKVEIPKTVAPSLPLPSNASVKPTLPAQRCLKRNIQSLNFF